MERAETAPGSGRRTAASGRTSDSLGLPPTRSGLVRSGQGRTGRDVRRDERCERGEEKTEKSGRQRREKEQKQRRERSK